ncbi:hypothetical protein BC332_10164 [Capsicum chinense]|nr:hypothetical protein BC332_10164 [Capsicum chinense]
MQISARGCQRMSSMLCLGVLREYYYRQVVLLDLQMLLPAIVILRTTKDVECYLNGNKLRGSIPGSFQHLKSLLYFSLCDNSLKGRLPTFLGQMPSLRSILLYGRGQSSLHEIAFRIDLGTWSEPDSSLLLCISMYLCKNFFDQTIPPELGSLPSLEYLDLSYNFLSGKIPDQLGNIKSLMGLYLIDNQLSDKLPDQLGNLVNLEELNLQNNEFIGPLPSTFKSLKKLTYLYITDVVGESSSFPDLSGMKFLRILTLRNCSIADRIPKWIWNLSGLQYLDLSFNSLFGGIPEEVDNSLNYIFLRKNKLNQIIPAWMNDTPFVDVSENLIRFVNISPEKKLNPDLFSKIHVTTRAQARDVTGIPDQSRTENIP